MASGGSPSVDVGDEGRKKWRSLYKRLYRFRAIVGVVAGLLSVGGFVYSFLAPATPRVVDGSIVAVVEEARSKQPLTDATVEILTGDDALVTTLSSTSAGRVEQSVREGEYTVRVTHPRFAPATRKVRVLAGRTTDLRVSLSPRPSATGASSASPSPTRAITEGVDAAQKLIRGLGK
jgi:carboxypeptidase family protein